MSIQRNKLWLKGFCPQRSDDEIRNFCDKYGKPIHMARPRGRDYIFLTYATEEEALQAQEKFHKDGFICNFGVIRAKSDTNDSSPTLANPDSAASPQSSPPNKHKKRVDPSNNIVKQQMSN